MGVVDGMRPLPRKVGDEEGGVQDVADGVLQQAVIREGAVAALVRQHPQAHRRCARHEGVGNPQRQRDQLERDEKAKRGSGRGDDQRLDEVAERARRAACETVVGYHRPHRCL